MYTIREQAGAVIRNAAGKILVLKRNPERYEGWGFVKGGIEGNESARDAIIREITEEVGMTIDPATMRLIDLTHQTTHYHQKNRYLAVVHWFLLQINHSDPIRFILEEEEWEKWVFDPPEEAMQRLAWHTEQQALEVALLYISTMFLRKRPLF